MSYSNYYIKLQLTSEHSEDATCNDDLAIKIPIEHDNVFTVCPVCGEEHQIDLSEGWGDEFDFYGTAVYCKKCTELRRESHEEE